MSRVKLVALIVYKKTAKINTIRHIFFHNLFSQPIKGEKFWLCMQILINQLMKSVKVIDGMSEMP